MTKVMAPKASLVEQR